jgi:hypothetical protein
VTAIGYRILSISTGEEENSTEAHVLARAYRAAWRAAHGGHPIGMHEIYRLNIVIDFGAQEFETEGTPRRARLPRPVPEADGPHSADADSGGPAQGLAEVWTRFLRLIGKQASSRDLERALAGWGLDSASSPLEKTSTRERLDLMRGWVPEEGAESSHSDVQARSRKARRGARSR